MVRPESSEGTIRSSKPHSKLNNKSVSLCFINSTDRTVHVIWLDFRGEPVIYCSLGHHCGIHINTFENHPWIIEDSETGDRMLAAGQKIYYPIQDRNDNNNNQNNRDSSKAVFITRPLLTLREHALQKVRDSVNEIDDIKSFNIPRTLLDDISEVLTVKKLALENYSKCVRYQSTLQ